MTLLANEQIEVSFQVLLLSFKTSCVDCKDSHRFDLHDDEVTIWLYQTGNHEFTRPHLIPTKDDWEVHAALPIV